MNKKCGVCRGEGLSGPSPLKKNSEKVRSFHYLTKRNDAIYMPDQFITSTFEYDVVMLHSMLYYIIHVCNTYIR